MKDIKSYIIGFSSVACLFLIMGQTNDKGIQIFDKLAEKEILVVGFVQTQTLDENRTASMGAGTDGDGGFMTFSKREKKVYIGGRGGQINIFNKYQEKVVDIQANKNENGMIALYDKFGELG